MRRVLEMGSLIIAFSSPGRRPVSIAIVEDPELLCAAARSAIREAEERRVTTADSDPVLGLLQAAEVARLRIALRLLVPGLNEDNDTNAVM
jgi:hypothetical protein